MNDSEVKRMVYEALDAAKDNEYWWEDLQFWSDDQIATDLNSYAGDLDQISNEAMIPHIKSWRERQ